jgi:hypothetical protein
MNITDALSHNIAGFQSQVLGSLFGPVGTVAGELFSTLLGQQSGRNKPHAADLLGAGKSANAPAAHGRNLALFNPESAFRLSTIINNRDVLYKAQFAELGQIKHGVSQLQAAGEVLGKIDAATQPAAVEGLLQNFIGRYNHWRESFNADVEQGGLLDNVQAAEVSLYELEQSIGNRFFGAQDGVRGLRDLGIRIDPVTHSASLDSQQLAATLGANPQGVLGAIHEFSANFAKSAALLNSDNNFIPNQLNNLGRVIHYIDEHKAALAQEFGNGDPAIPSGKIAQALALYQQISA